MRFSAVPPEWNPTLSTTPTQSKQIVTNIDKNTPPANKKIDTSG